MTTTLTANNPAASLAISHYEPGKMLRHQKSYTHSVLLSTDGSLQPWRPLSFFQLELADLQSIPDNHPLLIIGTGQTQQLLSKQQKQCIESMGTPYEVMHSLAACRTFNLMLTDQRRALLALLIH